LSFIADEIYLVSVICGVDPELGRWDRVLEFNLDNLAKDE
jgi:hypothetical protein